MQYKLRARALQTRDRKLRMNVSCWHVGSSVMQCILDLYAISLARIIARHSLKINYSNWISLLIKKKLKPRS